MPWTPDRVGGDEYWGWPPDRVGGDEYWGWTPVRVARHYCHTRLDRVSMSIKEHGPPIGSGVTNIGDGPPIGSGGTEVG